MSAGATATDPPPSAPRPFRFMRLRRGKVFGGVAGGIGRAAGVDLSLARLAVFGACLTGVGLLAYFVLWLVLPQEEPWRGELVERAPEPTGLYLRIALAVGGLLGVLELLGSVGGALAWGGHWGYGPGPRSWDFGGGLGLLLLGFGAALLITRRRGPGPDPTPPAASTPAATEGVPWTAGPGDGEPTASTEFAVEESTPRSLIAARVLGWFVVLWSVVVGFLGFALWWAGALRPGSPAVAIPLGIAAFVALVWVLIRSRRAGAILLALLVLCIPVALASQVRLNGDLGVRELRPTDSTVERHYRIAAGQLVLDLRDLEVPEGTRRVTIEMGAGQVTVRLPADVTSDVTARTRLGGVAVLGDVRGGQDNVASGHVAGCPERGHLVVDIRVRVGHAEVEGPGMRATPPVCATPAPA